MTVDLTTTYMGLHLSSPVVASASPLTGRLDTLRQLESAGAAAVVLPSLFEEQIEHDANQYTRLIESTAGGFAESADGFFPGLDDYNTGPHDYLRLVTEARNALNIPVIGSLNGATLGGWTRYAKRIEDAGAAALELNVYFIANDPNVTATEVEDRYIDLIERVRGAISIPLAVKVGPFFSSFANMAQRISSAGADALVLFNRFYQPDIDPDELVVAPNLTLSRSDDLRLPLRWIAALFGRIEAQLAATSGVHSGIDAVKLVMAGADVTMTTAALLRHGPRFVKEIRDGLATWMVEHEYSSVEQMRGSMSQINAPDPSAFERHNYMKALTTYAS